MNSGFLGDTEAINRRVMTMFFLIDSSGSMHGKKIGAVNSTIEELINNDLKDLSESNPDAEIKLAVMKFSTDCEWMTPAPVSLERYGDWENIEADGLTAFGEACEELCSKLSQKTGFMTRESSPMGYFAPVIILMSDGAPTDNFENSLAKLKENKWFKSAMKIAIAIGEDADDEVLIKFTGNKELVIHADKINMLKKAIKVVAVTSSQIASSSSSVASSAGAEAYAHADTSDVSSRTAEAQLVENLADFKNEAAASSDDDFDDEEFD